MIKRLTLTTLVERGLLDAPRHRYNGGAVVPVLAQNAVPPLPNNSTGSSSRPSNRVSTCPTWSTRSAKRGSDAHGRRLQDAVTSSTAFVSSDGSSWNGVGTATTTLPGTVMVGLVVCSINTGLLNASTSDSVTVQGG